MAIYFLLRIVSYPFSFLPYSVLHAFGRAFGRLAFHLHPRYRKRTLNNLAIAGFPKEERKQIALASFQNLFITIFELARLIQRPEEFPSRAVCENPEVFDEAKGKGVVLISSHQTNWEIGLFDLIPGSRGVTIGRPHKNQWLYQWVLSMRERGGNRIIPKKNALKQGMQALKTGHFFAFFADQAVPKSPYTYPFFGKRAYTTLAPALVAYRTQSPLCVVTKKRLGTRYVHHYSELIWPDRKKHWKEEVPRMMDCALERVEKSIRERPGEWLWQHNRWKQGNDTVCKKYRHDFILVVMPTNRPQNILSVLKRFYPRAHITTVSSKSEAFLTDGTIQLVFDFVGIRGLKRHFLKQGAFEVLTVKTEKNLEELLYEKTRG